MNHPRSTFVLLLVLSLKCADSLAFATSTSKAACINELFELPCPVEGPWGERLWRYRKYPGNWQNIASTFNNKTSLSSKIPKKFKNINISSNWSLTMPSFAPELNGLYECQSDNDGQVFRHIYKVKAVSCKKHVCEGDDVIIECDMFPGLKKLRELEWKQDGKTLVVVGPNKKVTYQRHPHIGVMKGNGALIIRSANKHVEGQYTCIGHGEDRLSRREYSVHVQKCKNAREACVGESIDLKCPYYPLATKTGNVRLEWYNRSTKIAVLEKQGHAIHQQNSLIKINETTGIITFIPLGVFDNESYRCKVFRDTTLLAEHNVTVSVTQCPGPTGRPKPTEKDSSEDPGNNEPIAKAVAEKNRENFFLVLFAVFVGNLKSSWMCSVT